MRKRVLSTFFALGLALCMVSADARKKFNDTALKSENASMNDLLAMHGVEQTAWLENITDLVIPWCIK